MKLKKCGELSFLLGTVLLGLATSLMSKAGFGVSMVVAPAYVIAEKVQVISAGTMCYIKQGVLILLTSLIMRRFRVTYLFSFLSAVLFGLSVDFFTGVCLAWVQSPSLPGRIALFCIGIPINSFSIALLFHTYFPPQAPELFVKELSRKYGWAVYKTKYVFDLSFCVLSIVLSLLFFRRLLYIGVGTVICALVNAPLIGFFGKILDRVGEYDARFPRLAALFEKN